MCCSGQVGLGLLCFRVSFGLAASCRASRLLDWSLTLWVLSSCHISFMSTHVPGVGGWLLRSLRHGICLGCLVHRSPPSHALSVHRAPHLQRGFTKNGAAGMPGDVGEAQSGTTQDPGTEKGFALTNGYNTPNPIPITRALFRLQIWRQPLHRTSFSL